MRIRNTYLCALTLLLCVMLSGFSAWGAADAPEKVPQRIFLGIAADPAHSQPVTWRTQAAVESPQAQVAPWASDPKFEGSATTVQAKAAAVEVGAGVSVAHYEATFEGLEPGKEYAYRVGDGTVWSEWNHFQTAAAGPEAFRFIYLGDAQRGVKSLWSRVVREAVLHAPDARFIVHAGDHIEEGYDDALWGEWCYGLEFISAMIPNIAAVGNHDMNLPPDAPNPDKPVSVSPLWRAHFAFPLNGPADAPMLEEEAYYVDYQGVRFVVVETNAFSFENYEPAARETVKKKEVEWLVKVLKHNPNRWTVVLQHEPMYQVGKNPDNPPLRELLMPLYEKYGVDLVLQGHDHTYARTKKLAAGQPVAADAPGIIYATSVSGSRMYPFNTKYEALMAKSLANTQMYQVIGVDGDGLRYEAYTVSGDLVDAFELRKDAQGKSTYAEKAVSATVAAP